MEFTFLCGSDEVAFVLRKMDGCGVLPFSVKQESISRHGRYTKINYADDLLMRELRLWSAAAFACGLIESPRIERL